MQQIMLLCHCHAPALNFTCWQLPQRLCCLDSGPAREASLSQLVLKLSLNL